MEWLRNENNLRDMLKRFKMNTHGTQSQVYRGLDCSHEINMILLVLLTFLAAQTSRNN